MGFLVLYSNTWHGEVSCRALPWNITLYILVSYHTIPCSITWYMVVSYYTISYHTLLPGIYWHPTIPYHTVTLYMVVSYYTTSYDTLLPGIYWYPTIPYHTVLPGTWWCPGGDSVCLQSYSWPSSWRRGESRPSGPRPAELSAAGWSPGKNSCHLSVFSCQQLDDPLDKTAVICHAVMRSCGQLIQRPNFLRFHLYIICLDVLPNGFQDCLSSQRISWWKGYSTMSVCSVC